MLRSKQPRPHSSSTSRTLANLRVGPNPLDDADARGAPEAMMDRIGLFSVHEVVEHLDQLHGRSVRVIGVLQLEFEDNSLWHLPNSERVNSFPYRSSLWV